MSHRNLASTLGLLFVTTFAPVGAAEAPLFDGRPDFAAGTDLGYFVWRDANEWHVRWTTEGNQRHFSGSVTSEGGDLKSLERIDVEKERQVVAAGKPARVVRGPHGRVHVKPGHGPVVATKEQDKIEKEGDRHITWTSRNAADIDGFDFKVEKGVTVLRFVMAVDGETRSKDVVIGRTNRHPEQNPFRVNLH